MNLYTSLSLSARKSLGFNDYPLLIIGIPVMAFIMPLIFFQSSLEEGFIAYCPNWGVGAIYTAFYWLGNRFIIIKFRKRYPSPRKNRTRVIFQSITMILFVVISSLTIDYILYDLLGLSLPEDEVSESQMLLPSLFSTLAIASIYEAAYYISQWKQSIEEAERLKRENTISQLDSLRNQVNPHFLFNSLNTLANLIPEDGDKAVEFVQNLAKVYRHILEIGERELISLREELEAIQAYRFLVQSRFGDNLCIGIDIPESALYKHIVPLSVQMLMENAIKHNIVSTKRPLHIDIFCDQTGDLVVRNNLQRKGQVNDSTGVGLKNISNRYDLVSNANIDIIVSESHYNVVLPLLEVQEYAHLDH